MDINVPILLSISAKDLINKDSFSKSDPFCVIYSDEVELGRTETIKNNLSPVFSTKIQLKYYFEKIQLLRFNIRDDDGKKSQDLGSVTIALSEIITKSEIQKPLLLNNKEKGSIIINGREIKEIRPGKIKLTLSGVGLDKKDTFGKSDPYVIIYNSLTNSKLYSSEVIKNTLNPNWNPFNLDLCERIRIECFDWDKTGSHDLIGLCDIDVANIKDSQEAQLISKKGKKSGLLKFYNVKELKEYSFLDYIQTGTQLNFAVAIDFTGSNGNPQDTHSLHYINSPMTAYEHAISSIGGVLEYYDSDRLFPVYGFGAKIKGIVYHDFNVSFQPNANVFGVSGILGAYRNCLSQVELYGPTVFRTNSEFCTNY
eukprot:NODE_94_length_21515_cov_0.130417.p8 type:complete len:368 gc:universal NODE_94_length_21515_cov_0.130417:1773-670(-)